MDPAQQPSPAQPPQLPQLQVRYCGIHGLVIGPDGRCIICKRNAGEPVKEGSGRAVVTTVLVLAAALGGVLLYKGLSGPPGAHAPVETPVAVGTRAPQPVPIADDPHYMADEQARGEAEAARSMEKQRNLEEAEHKVVVRVYTTEACDLCRTGTAYLKEKGMAYTELDVDKDEVALATLRKLRPEPMVPTFEVDGEVVVGFGPREMGAAIARAAQRRAR
jgi:glutaredoxin 3